MSPPITFPSSECRVNLSMSQDYIPRMVTDVVEIQLYHEAQLDLFRSFRHHPSEYMHSAYGCLEYTSQAVRPYGELILKAIPAGVHAPSMLPEGRLQRLTPHIVEFLIQMARFLCLPPVSPS
ncbi:hypothetical protein C8J57DRAFT_1492333 [Mycena rebaudengoi]|nr:hypothetical protein C8J57DRAFT_1492333 [Mycena rebaudengoi]